MLGVRVKCVLVAWRLNQLHDKQLRSNEELYQPASICDGRLGHGHRNTTRRHETLYSRRKIFHHICNMIQNSSSHCEGLRDGALRAERFQEFVLQPRPVAPELDADAIHVVVNLVGPLLDTKRARQAHTRFG